MKTAYYLKDKIEDGRKLTLEVQWNRLDRETSIQCSKFFMKLIKEVIKDEDMIFFGYLNGRTKDGFPRTNLWMLRDEFRAKFSGYIRTEEPVKVQQERLKEAREKERSSIFVEEESTLQHPFYPQSTEDALEKMKAYCTNDQRRFVMKKQPAEFDFEVEQRQYKSDKTYSIIGRISVSGYAIDYALQEWVEKYKGLLQRCQTIFPVFVSFIFYEMQTVNSHTYFFNNVMPMEGGMTGYEWAAYISNALVAYLPEDSLKQLAETADITKEEHGIFYQTRCNVAEFDIELQKKYETLFRYITRPGYNAISIHELLDSGMYPIYDIAYVCLYSERFIETVWKDHFDPYKVLGYYKQENLPEFFIGLNERTYNFLGRVPVYRG